MAWLSCFLGSRILWLPEIPILTFVFFSLFPLTILVYLFLPNVHLPPFSKLFSFVSSSLNALLATVPQSPHVKIVPIYSSLFLPFSLSCTDPSRVCSISRRPLAAGAVRPRHIEPSLICSQAVSQSDFSRSFSNVGLLTFGRVFLKRVCLRKCRVFPIVSGC